MSMNNATVTVTDAKGTIQLQHRGLTIATAKRFARHLRAQHPDMIVTVG